MSLHHFLLFLSVPFWWSFCSFDCFCQPNYLYVPQAANIILFHSFFLFQSLLSLSFSIFLYFFSPSTFLSTNCDFLTIPIWKLILFTKNKNQTMPPWSIFSFCLTMVYSERNQQTRFSTLKLNSDLDVSLAYESFPRHQNINGITLLLHVSSLSFCDHIC